MSPKTPQVRVSSHQTPPPWPHLRSCEGGAASSDSPRMAGPCSYRSPRVGLCPDVSGPLGPVTPPFPQIVAAGSCPWIASWEAKTPAWAGGRGKSVFAMTEPTSVEGPCSLETGC